MSIELYLSFCLATLVLILMPGPIVTLVVAQSLRHGTATGLATVAGSTIGNMVLVAAGAFGLSTMLTLLSDVFDLVRWLGAAYLIWLGVRELRNRGVGLSDADAGERSPNSKVFWQGIVVAVTNPKTILFYVAFFPQFIDPAAPLGSQLALMCVSFLVIGTVFDSAYALLAGRLRGVLQSGRGARIRSRITGCLLIGTGIGLVLARS
ncbi:MAG: LysE family translocator [Rhodospirillaceae bacterium]|jgi:threonine/homoserine/homoserine lactone efflux protein|nr:LysE family translocator [Rhodospirillaceae bacterium]MBT4688681.1 LysE family translocator [Rhodospirillaceae bacterium]MBT5078968.1 LysE family translocator [Rhodospirillaceae bacterium]MBT5523387.1 LysE family translocator [Rhodospirillaceae bacterium]MBT5878516.1 LysE family translocator [Rhodospirillaceae bacterium]